MSPTSHTSKTYKHDFCTSQLPFPFKRQRSASNEWAVNGQPPKKLYCLQTTVCNSILNLFIHQFITERKLQLSSPAIGKWTHKFSERCAKQDRPHRKWIANIVEWCGRDIQELSHELQWTPSDVSGRWILDSRWWRRRMTMIMMIYSIQTVTGAQWPRTNL